MLGRVLCNTGKPGQKPKRQDSTEEHGMKDLDASKLDRSGGTRTGGVHPREKHESKKGKLLMNDGESFRVDAPNDTAWRVMKGATSFTTYCKYHEMWCGGY
jgi:hypothetical protein